MLGVAVRLYEELLAFGHEWSDDQLRVRVGELRAYDAILGAPDLLAARRRRAQKAAQQRGQERHDAATRRPTYEDELDMAIAEARAKVAELETQEART